MRIVEKRFAEEYNTRVVVGSGLLGAIGKHVEVVEPQPSKVLVVHDDRIPWKYVEELASSLREAGLETHVWGITGGERAKSLETATSMWRLLVTKNYSRDSLLIAVGGGTVTDVVGFVAATYMRGVSWAVVPTTMLAMVDAAVGGKTAINLHAKNVIGAFHHPTLVLVDTVFIQSLPENIYREGLSEVVKHAIIDGGFFHWVKESIDSLLAREEAIVEEIIARSLSVKLDIVARDPRETSGYRMILNLGHTIGHALERASSYQISHGRAVAVGLLVEGVASIMTTGFSWNQYRQIHDVIEKLGLGQCPREISEEAIIDSIGFDKKRRGEKIILPLIRRIGDVGLYELGFSEAKEVLAKAWRMVCGGE